MDDLIVTFFEHFLELLMPVTESLVLWTRFHDPDLQLCLSSKHNIQLEINLFFDLCKQKIQTNNLIKGITLSNYNQTVHTVSIHNLIFKEQTSEWHIAKPETLKKQFDDNFVMLTFNLNKFLNIAEIEMLLLEKFIPRFLPKIRILEIVPKVERKLQTFRERTKSKCSCKEVQCKTIHTAILEIVRKSKSRLFQDKCLALSGCDNMFEFSRSLKKALEDSNIHKVLKKV